MANKYVSEGAELRCNSGSKTSKLQVTSQNKVKLEGKYQATEKDKTLMGNFGSCSLCNGNTCVPSLQKWKITSNKPTTFQAPLLLENSYIQCSVGGIIEITNPNQKTLKEGGGDDELDKYYPVLKGDVIFVNGYHSNPLENWEQTLYNAILDKVHEEGEGLQGESVNEHNHTDANDMFTNRELRDVLPENARQDKIEQELARESGTTTKNIQRKIIKSVNKLTPTGGYLEDEFLKLTSFNNKLEKFWNYWNDKPNDYKGSEIYCKAFNSVGRDHYINGSHGLGSNAAHRIDHGIALGYKWASENWQIYPKKMIKSDAPMSKLSFTPTYRPITVVGHSQGAAMGTGVALGIMYYAKEIGWDEMALNVIYLGVNQPQGLHGEEYENLIKDKVDFYQVDANDFVFFGKDKKGTLVNGLSQIFDKEYNKLLQERGIYEHLKAILKDWDAYKERCVQFTFSNDRGDMVIRDGDIPEIKSACDPDRNTDAFHLHYLGRTVSAKSDKGNPKMKHYQFPHGKAFIKWYDYMANRRFDPKKLYKEEEVKKIAPHLKDKSEWGTYMKIAKDCMQAFDVFIMNKQSYEFCHKEKFTPKPLIGEFLESSLGVMKFVVMPAIEMMNDKARAYNYVNECYDDYLKKYAALQEAQLYAHFAPVAFIRDIRILQPKIPHTEKEIWRGINGDFPNDQYGITTIFDRINKAGENIFYRLSDEQLNKDRKGNTITTPQGKFERLQELLEEMEKRMLLTSVIDTPYIHNVIRAYVKNDEKALEKLYKEPKYQKK
ncbi:hypothetical protein CAPN001_02230 [Capnocytophaga stomatis]|uniref:DUF4280 domain-containing protein n=1 Tax=Capnocytophaga stomatis TaxID=1848904 RepID=UPI00194E1B6F|nr:DUF4280 domain-containing protein [Capnocytophaga stomatis]GIJ95654.1 hypothetical protein CAPN001_02230 [Capnocytophaga stomatis]